MTAPEGCDRPAIVWWRRCSHRASTPGVPGESFLAVLDGFYEHQDRIRFIACRQEGAAFMADAQVLQPAGHLLRDARPGRDECSDRGAPGSGQHADDPVHRPGGERPARPRGVQELDYRQVFGPGTLGLAKWVGG